MNYWLLTTEYPPFFGGGIGTYCYQTASMLVAEGYTVSVFVNDSTVTNFEISTVNGVRCIRFNPSRTKSASFLGHVTNISYAFADIARHFIEKEGKPDIIESQEYLGIAYYLLQFKYLQYQWCKDIPVLVTMHSPSSLYMEYNRVPRYSYPNFWICEMEFFCLRAADHVISPSQYMIDELSKRFSLDIQDISVVPNPYNINENAVDNSDSNGEILFYGKLTAQKGAFELLKYFQNLWDNGFERPLHLLGGQEIVYHPEGRSMGDILKKKYKEYIDKGLLYFEGKVRPTDLKIRLRNAAVVIVPSNNDNFPYTVVELMALGKIVLVSKQGGHSELVRNEIDGFVFDHNFPETFSIQLNRILSLDKKDRRKISEEAHKRVSEVCSFRRVFTLKKEIVKQLVNFPQNREYYPFSYANEKSKVISSIAKTKILSVVVPYYNMGKYVEQTIESIQSSDYPAIEIIIVNDGSTEKTSLDILDTFRSQKSITVLDIVNQGLGNARNVGAQNAGGEYLAFLDADDKIKPDYYTKAIRVLEKFDNVHFAGCWTQYFEGSLSSWPCFTPEPPLVLFHNVINSSALVYKREAFVNGGTNDSKMPFPGWEDYESVLAMINNGYNGVVLPERLFEYRVRKNSMIRNVSDQKKIYLAQYVSAKYASLYNMYGNELFRLQNANGPGIYLDNPSLDLHLANRIPIGGKLSLKLVRAIKSNPALSSVAYKIYKMIKTNSIWF